MGILQIFDWHVTPYRCNLFEWCDLAITPDFVKHRCQSMLTAQWTHKLPFIQQASPAHLAAALIQRALSEIEDIDTESYTIIDFCSGAGGPIPTIEKAVNHNRKTTLSLPPIPFKLSDITPNLDAWIQHSSHSANLSFIPQPVDATKPPASVISKSSSLCPFPDSAGKTFHLFCLSFHHFNDQMAKEVMKGCLETSDGFAIIELQDRKLGTLVLMLGEAMLLFLVTIFWFYGDWLHLACVYWVPVLPVVMVWDGVVSCLRTRTFQELIESVEEGVGEMAGGVHVVERKEEGGEEIFVVQVGDQWRCTGVRARHTWPWGYMNAFVGHKTVK